MTRLQILKRILAVWVVLLFALNYIAYVRISWPAGAGPLMDLRPLGYSQDDVYEFATKLGFDEITEYLRGYLWLDYLFIICTAILLITAAGAFASRLRFLVWALVAVFVAADMIENTLLRHMIPQPPIPDSELPQPLIPDAEVPWVAIASTATQLKFFSLLVAAGLLTFLWRKGASV